MEESLRSKRVVTRIIYFVLAVASTIVSIVSFVNGANNLEQYYWFTIGYITVPFAIVFVVFFFATLAIKICSTLIGENRVICYCGMFTNKLYVDGTLHDAQSFSFYQRPLHGNLSNGDDVEAVIHGVFVSRVIIKANGMVIKSF